MPPVVIDNPILNSPFAEPSRHFQFSEDGITDQAVDGRRESGYFLPIASPRKKGEQLRFEREWTEDRFQSSPRINRIRERVGLWRQGGYVGCSRLSDRLLRYWSNPERERRLFFCQVEALETAIYLTEVASHYGDSWIENEIREENAGFNNGLPRLAFKMATGSGKTVVMAMLIAWQALNKIENRKDRRFSDAFLVVTPGITIRDRLRVLLPTDPANYYRERHLLPPDLLERLSQAGIVITNYHTFIQRERGEAARLIDTNYDGEGFFVRHAYFTGADEPYERLRRALRAEIDEAAWSSLYSTVSRPFAVPETGKIAVKVINHYGDEVLKVFDV